MRPEVFCDSSKTNTGEEVDGKPCVPRVVSWQKSLPTHLQCGVPCPRNKFGQAHEFRKLLEENLDEDPGGAGGVVLVELDHAENPPLDRVCVQQVGVELGHIPEFSCLEPMYCVVGVDKDILEGLGICPGHLAKSLPHEPKELLISSLLSTTIDDHVTELRFLARLDLQFQQLVHSFLKV